MCLLCFRIAIGFVVWLVALFIGWLAGWLVSWLVGWLIDWLNGWLAGWLVGWLVGCLVGWLDGQLVFKWLSAFSWSVPCGFLLTFVGGLFGVPLIDGLSVWTVFCANKKSLLFSKITRSCKTIRKNTTHSTNSIRNISRNLERCGV